MPKGEFKCGLCKKTIRADDSWSNTDKFVCPTHKGLCVNCVNARGLLNIHYECKKCGATTTEQTYHKSYGKWMRRA